MKKGFQPKACFSGTLEEGKRFLRKQKGFVFTVDALYALALVFLLANLYIINSAGAGPLDSAWAEKAVLAKDKALTAFYRGQPLQGNEAAVAKAADYYCHKIVRDKAGSPAVERQCEVLR